MTVARRKAADGANWMATDLSPIVGNWYQPMNKGQAFAVVGIDEDAGVIEIQHYDGDVAEVEMTAWDTLDLELAEPPEDWTAPMDNVDVDDMGYTDTQMEASDWPRPLQEIQTSGEEGWEAAEPEDERDDWDEGEFPEQLYGSEPEE
jgi:hypothetical protein